MKPFSARRASMIAAAALGIALLAGCSAGAPTRDETTNEITEAGDADVFQIAVGDCTNDVADGEMSEVPVVPCGEPHDNEIFFAFDMPDGEFPGAEAFSAAAEEQCPAAFESFVGIALADSMYQWWPITPSEGSWNEGNDREILCLAFDPSLTQIEGSLAGAAR